MQISKQKKDKILDQILAYLYSIAPKAVFTVEIAKEMARDEEFTKKLLLFLKEKKLVFEVKKNPKGKEYLKRSRWRLSDLAYNSYKSKQQTIVLE